MRDKALYPWGTRARLLTVLVLLALVQAVSAAPNSSTWLGDGKIIAGYGLQDGSSIVVAVMDRDLYIITTPLREPQSEQRIYMEGKGMPPMISTEVCGGFLHIFYNWPGDDMYHYAHPVPVAHDFYLPVVCQ